MTAAPPAQPAADPALACVRCGYCLTGLADDGACPECAVPIAASYRAVTCAFASPARLRATRRATTVLGITLVLGYAGNAWSMLQWVPSWLLSLMSSDPVAYASIMALMFSGVQFLMLWGWWSVASHDPTVNKRASAPWPNRLLRWTVPTSLAATLFLLFWTFWSAGSTRAPTKFDNILAIAWIVAIAITSLLGALQLWMGATILFHIRRTWKSDPLASLKRAGPRGRWMHLVFGAAFLTVLIDDSNSIVQYTQLFLYGSLAGFARELRIVAGARTAADLLTPPLFLVILLLARRTLTTALRDLRTQLAPATTPAGSTP